MLLDCHSHPTDDTRVLLIDFDHGEIKEQTDNGKKIKDEDKNSKTRQRVVCPYICLYWAWLMTYLGNTHLHGPLGGYGTSSGRR